MFSTLILRNQTSLCSSVLGVIGSGIFLVVAGYIESSESTVAALCIAVAFYGFAFSAYMVNPMDIAPRYSDTIIGVSNALATIPGFVGPAIVGIVTKHRVSIHHLGWGGGTVVK